MREVVNSGRNLAHGVARNVFRHLASEARKREPPETTMMGDLRRRHYANCQVDGGVERAAEAHLKDLRASMEVRTVPFFWNGLVDGTNWSVACI